MILLLENLQSDVLNRNVKISILSCFGDIALAIGVAFEPYVETTMGVLRQAGAVMPIPVRLYFTKRGLMLTFGLAGLRSHGLCCSATGGYLGGLYRDHHWSQKHAERYAAPTSGSHATDPCSV
jgi:hypothetical protein